MRVRGGALNAEPMSGRLLPQGSTNLKRKMVIGHIMDSEFLSENLEQTNILLGGNIAVAHQMLL